MTAARKTKPVDEELTPEARLDRAKRMLITAVDELVDAKVERVLAGAEYYTQYSSPLGNDKRARRRFRDLARAGKFPSVKEGNRILVKREDFHAFLDREGIARGTRREDEDVDDVIERIQKGGGRR